MPEPYPNLTLTLLRVVLSPPGLWSKSSIALTLERPTEQESELGNADDVTMMPLCTVTPRGDNDFARPRPFTRRRRRRRRRRRLAMEPPDRGMNLNFNFES